MVVFYILVGFFLFIFIHSCHCCSENGEVTHMEGFCIVHLCILLAPCLNHGKHSYEYIFGESSQRVLKRPGATSVIFVQGGQWFKTRDLRIWYYQGSVVRGMTKVTCWWSSRISRVILNSIQQCSGVHVILGTKLQLDILDIHINPCINSLPPVTYILNCLELNLIRNKLLCALFQIRAFGSLVSSVQWMLCWITPILHLGLKFPYTDWLLTENYPLAGNCPNNSPLY